MATDVNLDDATRYLETLLKTYRESLKVRGEIEADDSRMHFAGAKHMLEILVGERAKNEVVGKLRAKGFKIPPTGPRIAGEITGHDMDSDLDFFEWAVS